LHRHAVDRGTPIVEHPMRYAPLGRTGLTVSRLCLGCMSYGSSKWRPWVLDEPEARHFFRASIEHGINFFDTADMYSLGASEEVTGRALREYGVRDELVIATKVHFPMSDRPNMGGLGRKHVVQGCEASLKRLGVEAIDLYQIHRFDPVVPIEETLAALDHLVHSGKVRYVGASSGAAWQMARALFTADARGWTRFVSMQNHYNLLYREEEREMIPLCQAEGVGIIPWSPLARGRLARPRADASPSGTARAQSDDFANRLYDDEAMEQAIVDAVHAVAAERGTEPATVALAWLLARPGVVAPIVGATKPHHLDAAVSALELELTPDEMARLEAPYRPRGVRH
jgi:aryl-alcohol dehydrogenase-like predicted oxidoreductase